MEQLPAVGGLEVEKDVIIHHSRTPGSAATMMQGAVLTGLSSAFMLPPCGLLSGISVLSPNRRHYIPKGLVTAIFCGGAGLGTSSGSANAAPQDRKSTRLNSSHGSISYAVFCL